MDVYFQLVKDKVSEAPEILRYVNKKLAELTVTVQELQMGTGSIRPQVLPLFSAPTQKTE